MEDPQWEISKENVAPLRAGRDVNVLNNALKMSKHQLEEQRLAREQQVRDAIAGLGPHKDDPLEAWSRYAKWIVQNYPSASEQLIRVVEEVCRMYAKNPRYRDDIRLVRLWLRYIDLRDDKLDAFNYMNRKRIGESWSLFYEAWAVTLEIARHYDEAERVYRTGREKQAKPVERLAFREQEYYNRMAARRRRDEKKKFEAEEKRIAESQREGARKGRESSRAASSLANTVLAETNAEEKSTYGALSQKVRPALGKINEFQAKSGHRPFVKERKHRRFDSVEQQFSHSRTERSTAKPQRFHVYADPDTNVAPAAYGMASNPKQMEDDEKILPDLAKRDEIRKEDEGRLPSKWAGETLPQETSLRSKLQKSSRNLFEVYQDPADVSSPTNEIIEAAIKDVRETRTKQASNFSGVLERCDAPQRTSSGTNPPSWPRDAADGSGSPTINTKLAMKEVDDIFNSSHPMDRNSEALRNPFAESTRGRMVEGTGATDAASGNVRHGGGRKNSAKSHPHPGNGRITDEDRTQRNEEMDLVPDSEDSVVVCADSEEGQVRKLYKIGPLEDMHEPRSECIPSSDLCRFNEYDMTEFLASWCNRDPHFQLLEDPDPEIAAEGMFDLQCRQGLVSFNVDKFQWTGYCDHSYVVLADDLNNTFGLLDMSKEIGSEDDDFKVVAIKVSRSSNAWEYYIYKTINSRMPISSKSIPRAISFCEGNPRSYLILDSYSSCSLQEATSFLNDKKFPESLSMFFTVCILRVLEDLHGIDMIHADVTLDNILFRNDLAMDISKHPYSANNDSAWSAWGVILIDYNHAIDARHPQLSRLDMNSLVRYVAGRGHSFLSEEYRMRDSENWAYNGDCYAASKCAAKMLGIGGSNFHSHANSLQHASTWEEFFLKMGQLHALSTSRETSEAMRTCRIQMEEILIADRLLSISLMQLVNQIVDAHNDDLTVGV